MLLKKLLYLQFVKRINRFILRLFYQDKYLRGKFFDEQRYGFVWAWRGIFRSFSLRRRGIYFPVGKNVRIANGYNLSIASSSLNCMQQPGCYYQNYHGKITIGENCWIAQNVGIITENHDPKNADNHLDAKDVVIGNSCWIGMNSVILPGVKLGNKTTVGAGSIVTHSFKGHCIIAGNPAKVIRELDD